MSARMTLAVRYLPHLLVGAFVGGSLLWPDLFITHLQAVTRAFLTYFDWFILLATSGFLLLCLYLACSRFGHLRLGRDDEEPEYSTPSWLAMLFAAGMGVGLVFWGTAEPLLHSLHPPPGSPYGAGAAEAMRGAMVITLLHWALHPWAVYAASALAIAYFTFRHDQPLLPSAPLRAVSRYRHPAFYHLIDGIALVAVVFGIIASLGQGVLQMGSGVEKIITHTPPTSLHYGIIICTLCLAYLISASGSLHQGIKTLSDINMLICIALMLFVLFSGPTLFLLQTTVASLGDYLSSLTAYSFRLRHFSGETAWTHDWTLTYFLWWIAWGPFVGVFIARISRGRTIREFLAGVVLVPSLFSLCWFAVLGGTSIHAQFFDQQGFAIDINSASAATYTLLERLPFAQITQAVTLLLVFLFLVTSADSGTYVLGMFSSDGVARPPVAQRLFWGVIIGVLTAIAMISGHGVKVMRSFAVAGAIPFLFIMIWQMLCLMRRLRQEQVHIPHVTTPSKPS